MEFQRNNNNPTVILGYNKLFSLLTEGKFIYAEYAVTLCSLLILLNSGPWFVLNAVADSLKIQHSKYKCELVFGIHSTT